MLYGIDISHHNQYMKDLEHLLTQDFVLMKATEGMGFRDGALDKYMSVLGNKLDPLVGFYHFARPEINSDPIVEANNFLGAIRKYLIFHPVLALDIEARALDCLFIDGWAYVWCGYVEQKTGIRPLIYCSSSETFRFKSCAKMGCGLWVAKWSSKKPTKKDIAPWDFYAFWQDSNNMILSGVRVDSDVFNGDKEQFLRYGGLDNGKETDRVTN